MVNTYGKRKQIEITGEDHKPTNINEMFKAVADARCLLPHISINS